MKWGKLLLAASLGSSTLSASILGTFSLGGDFFVNGTTSITWQNTNGTPNQAVISEATGAYAGLNNDLATIETLTSATEPVGIPFPDTAFVTLPGGPSPLLINFIFAGIDPAADCGAAPALGQTCTVPLPPPAVSPFNLQNVPPPISSSASFSVSGVVGNGTGEIWTATFTSQFNVPFQTVLAKLGPDQNLTVSDAYSGTFTVFTPETSTLSMVVLGLILMLASRSWNLIGRVRR